MADEQSIGIFDSGVGGLSVLAHIHQRLPGESLLYIADSAYMPYGCKPEAVIQQRCVEISAFLSRQQCKAIVVACNTATAAAVHHLRASYSFPVIGMEPAVKPAVLHSRSKVIGVLTTSATSASDKFNRLAARFAQHARLIVQPCPGLVERIESGDLTGNATRDLLTSFLQPLMRQGMDTLVLGCTHYPFLTALIRDIAGDDIHIIDTGDAIACELERQLQSRHLVSENKTASIEFWSSGDAEKVAPVMSLLWGSKMMVKKLPF
ncbi:MAG: glutamate racemase [Mariprofundus sp.]|nr:glutamate racemase [Mariprofundus sp.]